MSASGTGLFDDDVACNIRAGFRAFLSQGLAPAAATRALLREWKPALADAEDGPVVWLAMAATQCHYGCLEPTVKAKAMAVIDSGSDLVHWRAPDNPALVRSRAAVLKRLRAKLEDPPPARAAVPTKPKTKRKAVDEKSIWSIGEIFAYRLRSGRFMLMHVVDFLGTDRPGDSWWSPMVAPLDWLSKTIPPAKQILKLPYTIRTDDPTEKNSALMFSLGRRRESEMPADRVVRSVATKPPAHWKKLVGEWGGCRCTFWRDLDRDLVDWLGWK